MNDDESANRFHWSPAEPKFNALLKRIAAESSAAYVVGGAVRDAMLHRLCRPESKLDNAAGKPADLDVALPADACAIARRVADREGWAFYKLDAERDIARLVYTDANPPLVCDVARFQGETLADDLAKRDFTINAMAFQIESGGGESGGGESGGDTVTLVDNHGGLRDLGAGLIRQVEAQSLMSDPVRLLRAVRFMAQLGEKREFAIEAETRRQILANASAISQSSQERINDELWKALSTRRPDAVVDELQSLNLLRSVLPEVANLVGVPQSWPHHLDVYQHTLAAVRHAGFLRDWLLRDNKPFNGRHADEFSPAAPPALMLAKLSPWCAQLREHFCTEVANGHLRAEWLVWLALFHDVGKPGTRSEEMHDGLVKQRFFEHEILGAELTSNRLTTLHFSRDEVKLAERAVTGHMRPHHLHTSFAKGPISRRACYRFFRDVGRVQKDSLVGVDVVLLALADMQGIHRHLNFAHDEQADGEPIDIGKEFDGQLTQAKSDPTHTIADWSAYLDHADQLIAYGLGDDGEPALRQNRLVDGNQLMDKLGVKPGPQLGQLLEKITEAQAAGEIETEEEALDWAALQLSKISA